MNGEEMESAEVASELRKLRDIEEIKQLKARHCRLVDTKDWAGWSETCLTEDFHLDSGGGVQDGRDAVVANVSAALNDASTVHHVYTPEITLTGPDTAIEVGHGGLDPHDAERRAVRVPRLWPLPRGIRPDR